MLKLFRFAVSSLLTKLARIGVPLSLIAEIKRAKAEFERLREASVSRQ